MAQPLWAEINQAIADRLRETEDISGVGAVGEVDIPYYSSTIIENSLLEVSQEILREIPVEDLESVSSAAVVTQVLSASPWPLPLNTIRVASVAIKPQSTDTKYQASQPLPPASFVMNQNVAVIYECVWSIFNAGLYFTGFEAEAVIVIEPAIGAWRSGNILPDGFTEEQIDRVIKQLQIMNYEPKGGI